MALYYGATHGQADINRLGIRIIIFSVDSKLLQYHMDKEIKLTTLVAFQQGNANYCSINNDGNLAIATSSSGLTVVIGLKNGRAVAVKVFHKHTSAVHQCCISAFGHVAATASLDGTIRVWNVYNPRHVWACLRYEKYARAVGAAISRSGNRIAGLFLSSKGDGAVVVYNLPTFEIIFECSCKADVFSGSIAISDDGAVIAYCTMNELVVTKISPIITQLSWPVTGQSHVSMSGDGNTIVVADDIVLRMIRIPLGSEVEFQGYERSFRPFCCINANATRIVAAVQGNKYRVWNTEAKVIANVIGFKQHTRGCSMSVNGHILLMCSYDGSVSITHLETSTKTT